MKINEVLKSMTNVPVSDFRQIDRIERLRKTFYNLAKFANEVTQDNKYQEIAFDKLENSLMYFVKAIVLETENKSKGE